jgi:nicotinate-nucleotide adenylyltransferase
MRIAICGGTFDPFHRGHLEPVLAVRGGMQWDRVIYVPAWRQPFKLDQSAASGYHRFAMAVLATEEHEGLAVSPMELERGEVSYTVDTLEALRREHPEASLDWIIGEDNVPHLAKWKNVERIFELANFVVLTRNIEDGHLEDGHSRPSSPVDGEQAEAAVEDRQSCSSTPTCGAIIYAHNETVPVSATDIRHRLRTGEPIDAFVDPRVARYILHNGLYREATT